MSCPSEQRGALQGLDHVAILVEDTEAALVHFRDRLGLVVVHQEDNSAARARLTYLQAGAALIQLLQPLDDDGPLGVALREQGEGLHHICFVADDVSATAAALGAPGATPLVLGSGRGRPSAFVPGPSRHGVRIEVTQGER